MMDSTRSKSPLDNFESSTFSQDHAGCRDPDILERDLGMTMWSVVIAIDRKHALNGDTRGSGWNEEHRVLFIRI